MFSTVVKRLYTESHGLIWFRKQYVTIFASQKAEIGKKKGHEHQSTLKRHGLLDLKTVLWKVKGKSGARSIGSQNHSLDGKR